MPGPKLSRLTEVGQFGLVMAPVCWFTPCVQKRIAPERRSRSNLPTRTWVLSSLSRLKRWVWARPAMVALESL